MPRNIITYMPQKELKSKLLGISRDYPFEFEVIFVKKNGAIRYMKCKRGVTSHLRGGTLPYNPKEHGLLTVFDVDKEEYRSVSGDSILQIQFGDEVFRVIGPFPSLD